MTKVDDTLQAMIRDARNGMKIYPFMYQPAFGRSNAVSGAIRKAKAQGILVEAGKDGCGKPFYELATPAATHTCASTLN